MDGCSSTSEIYLFMLTPGITNQVCVLLRMRGRYPALQQAFSFKKVELF
jgi:hypothetical protein